LRSLGYFRYPYNYPQNMKAHLVFSRWAFFVVLSKVWLTCPISIMNGPDYAQSQNVGKIFLVV
jgi:hypothetical protein